MGIFAVYSVTVRTFPLFLYRDPAVYLSIYSTKINRAINVPNMATKSDTVGGTNMPTYMTEINWHISATDCITFSCYIGDVYCSIYFCTTSCISVIFIVTLTFIISAAI
jgi:hypothetical protein